MRVELVSQMPFGQVVRRRAGDVLRTAIGCEGVRRFRFAVAFARLSGWDRLLPAIDALTNRGGTVEGAIGIDLQGTSREALCAIRDVAPAATIVYTGSSFIFHPKLYIVEAAASATVVVGSANLTCDGLFRNMEVCAALTLDLASAPDAALFEQYTALVDDLLNAGFPNVQPITPELIEELATRGILAPESSQRDLPKVSARGHQRPEDADPDIIATLFPPLPVPAAPPARHRVGPQARVPAQPQTAPPVQPVHATFIMRLSAHDCAHRTGIPGTPEILLPEGAIPFFPPMSAGARDYPDVYFDVVLNTPLGREIHGYRLWYYEQRATGSRIDEYRLRMDHDTIDMTTPGGGDLLIVARYPEGFDPQHEVTILPATDPTYPALLALCTNHVQDKVWGLA